LWKIHDDKMLMICYSDGISMTMVMEVMRGDNNNNNNNNNNNKYGNKIADKEEVVMVVVGWWWTMWECWQWQQLWWEGGDCSYWSGGGKNS